MFLQNVLYRDATPGIAWYIVVLLPADSQVDHLGPSSPYYFLSLIAATITIVVSVTALCATLLLWRTRMMELAQPMFIATNQFGCILLGISCIVFLGPNNYVNCTSRALLFNISFSIAFAPLLMKCRQVYKMFVYTRHILDPSGSRKLLSPLGFTGRILAFVLVDVLIIGVTVYLQPNTSCAPYTTTELNLHGAYEEFTYCGYHRSDAFFFAELGYKTFLILLGCYWSISIRSVVDAIAGSKELLLLMYSTTLIGAISVTVVRTVTNVEIVISCTILAISYCSILCAIIIAFPTVYSICLIGDQAAADNVMDDISSHPARMDVRTYLCCNTVGGTVVNSCMFSLI